MRSSRRGDDGSTGRSSGSPCFVAYRDRATGIGLIAAIPAVVFYNKLNADSERILGGYEAFADEFATILSRQLDA